MISIPQPNVFRLSISAAIRTLYYPPEHILSIYSCSRVPLVSSQRAFSRMSAHQTHLNDTYLYSANAFLLITCRITSAQQCAPSQITSYCMTGLPTQMNTEVLKSSEWLMVQLFTLTKYLFLIGVHSLLSLGLRREFASLCCSVSTFTLKILAHNFYFGLK